MFILLFNVLYCNSLMLCLANLYEYNDINSNNNVNTNKKSKLRIVVNHFYKKKNGE